MSKLLAGNIIQGSSFRMYMSTFKVPIEACALCSVYPNYNNPWIKNCLNFSVKIIEVKIIQSRFTKFYIDYNLTLLIRK